MAASIVIALMIIGLLFYVMYKARLREFTKDMPERVPLTGHRAQLALQSQFETDDVYGYTRDTWLIRKKTPAITKHYLVKNDGSILAETSYEGFIYAMYQCHRLFIATGGWEPEEERYYGALDNSFNITIPIIYEKLDALKDDFVKATKNNLIGVYDPGNVLIIPAEYDSVVQDITNQQFLLIKDGTHYLFNYRGKLLKTLNYSSLFINKVDAKTFIKSFIANEKQDFDNNNADEQLIEGKWGLLDESYEELIPPDYGLLYNSPDYALVMNGKLNIDTSVKPWPGMASMYFTTGGKWGVVDFLNQPKIPLIYDWIDFTPNKDVLLVNSGGKMHYINQYQKKGFWGIWGGKWGLINIDNEVILPFAFDHAVVKDDTILFQRTDKEQFDFDAPCMIFDLKSLSINELGTRVDNSDKGNDC